MLRSQPVRVTAFRGQRLLDPVKGIGELIELRMGHLLAACL